MHMPMRHLIKQVGCMYVIKGRDPVFHERIAFMSTNICNSSFVIPHKLVQCPSCQSNKLHTYKSNKTLN